MGQNARGFRVRARCSARGDGGWSREELQGVFDGVAETPDRGEEDHEPGGGDEEWV